MIIRALKQLLSKEKLQKTEKEVKTPAAKKENPVSQKTHIAPVLPNPDPWFSEPVKTEKMVAYEKHVAQKIEEQKFAEAAQPKKEPEDIHQQMYARASKFFGSWQENLGGSENFQEGPGEWNSGAGFQSGTGYNQFRG